MAGMRAISLLLLWLCLASVAKASSRSPFLPRSLLQKHDGGAAAGNGNGVFLAHQVSPGLFCSLAAAQKSLT